MTYSARELSQADGQPIEGYRFSGPFTNYDYTSHREDVTINGITFTALPLLRSKIVNASQNTDIPALSVEIPSNTELARDYVFKIAPQTLTLSVFRSHIGLNTATEFITYWKGEVESYSAESTFTKFKIPSNLSRLASTNIPTVYYQIGCNNQFGDARCKEPLGVLQESAVIDAVNNVDITVSTIGARVSDYFNIGKLTLANGETRMIIAHTGLSITINYPFSNISVGDNCTLQRGCDHNFDGDCLFYANQQNFNGLRFQPTENPFEGTVV
jgi:uncharacterized phage protein (TIGR02218 family)